MDTTTRDIAPGDYATLGRIYWRFCTKCQMWYQGKKCPICGKTQESPSEARAFGLPGQYTGAKAHSWFMKGHVAGFTGQVAYDTDKISKACARAYKVGYEKGKADRQQRESLVDAILEDTAKDLKRIADPDFLDQGDRKKDVGEPELVEMEPDDTMVFRIESGTEPGKFYDCFVQLLGWEDAKADTKSSLARRAKKALGSDLRLRCSCPSFKFHGFQYIETIRDSQFGPAEHRYPDVRNPELRGVFCKHLARLLDDLPRFEYDLYKFLKRD